MLLLRSAPCRGLDPTDQRLAGCLPTDRSVAAGRQGTDLSRRRTAKSKEWSRPLSSQSKTSNFRGDRIDGDREFVAGPADDVLVFQGAVSFHLWRDLRVPTELPA